MRVEHLLFYTINWNRNACESFKNTKCSILNVWKFIQWISDLTKKSSRYQIRRLTNFCKFYNKWRRNSHLQKHTSDEKSGRYTNLCLISNVWKIIQWISGKLSNCLTYKISRSILWNFIQPRKGLTWAVVLTSMHVQCMKFQTMKFNINSLPMQSLILQIAHSICNC